MTRSVVLVGGVALACLLGTTACGSSHGGQTASSSAPSGAATTTGTLASATPQTTLVQHVAAQQVCRLLGAPLVKAMLDGATPAGPVRPQSERAGKTTCTWRDSTGGSFSVTVMPIPQGATTGCDSPGRNISGPGWQGCVLNSGGAFGVGGSYYVELPAAHGMIETAVDERAVIADVLQGLHA